MRAIITGATGFIGRYLAKSLTNPILLGRNTEKINKLFPHHTALAWSSYGEVSLSDEIIAEADAVFHLAGDSVFQGRWNKQKKKRIRESRVQGTRSFLEEIAKATKRPPVFVCASAIGYYGDRGDEILDENSPPGKDFLADLCLEWEKEATGAENLGMRVVSIRTGLVLGQNGGALTQMLPPFKMGLGGRLGSGRQYMSWIHIEDLVGIMLHAALTESVSGPVNGVAPCPVTNADFTKILGKVLGRPTLFPVPKFALKMAFGEFGGQLVASQRVTPKKAVDSGYQYKFPDLKEALTDLLK